MTDTGQDRSYRRRVRAWALYDWADHGFITVTATTFFPPTFVALAAPAFLARGGAPAAAAALARNTAANVYAIGTSLALLVAAVLAPLVGTAADLTGRRKQLLLATTATGAALAAAAAVVTTGRWALGLALYLAAQVAVNIAFGLNSSLLAHVARPADLHRVSALGYGMGYVGGGLLLAMATALYLGAGHVGLSTHAAVGIAFVAVGVWWLLFSLPLAVAVPEPPALPVASGRGTLRAAVARLAHTLRDVRGHRPLFTMLVAFWLYMEGIGAIVLLATAYGAALGLPTTALIGTLLLTQFVAFPYALAFARIPRPGAPGRGRVVAMVVWTALSLPALGAVVSSRGGVGVAATLALIAADQLAGVALALTVGERLCGRFATTLDTRRAIAFGLVVYAIVPVWGFVLRTQAEFFLLGVLVGAVQGGTQALSRALYAELSPRSSSGEFFGLYALAEKFAGILGPLLFGVVGALTGTPRASILSVELFFILGLAILARVDVAAGTRAAREAERIEGGPTAPDAAPLPYDTGVAELVTHVVRLAPGWDTPPRREWCRTLERRAAEAGEGDVIYRGRNLIFRDVVDGEEVAVKRFPVTSPGKRLLYRWRASKGVRAFDHAARLASLGVGTPSPFAVVETRRGTSPVASCFCSAFLPSFREARELRFPEAAGREELLPLLGAFVGRLHDLGVVHRDLTAGNILLVPDAGVPEGVRFVLVDINRMRFGPVGTRAGIANLVQLRLNDDGELFAGYCRARGLDAARLRRYYDARLAWRSAMQSLKEHTRPWRRRLGL